MKKLLGAVSVLNWLLAGTASFSAPTTEQAGVDVPPPMDKIWCEAILDHSNIAVGLTDVRMGSKCNRRYRMPLMPERPPIYLPSHNTEQQNWSLDGHFYPAPLPFPILRSIQELNK